jgi:hypothetical protein
MRPTIVIAAVRRTGSTMLSEALTSLPTTFVYREPALFLGEVRLKDRDVAVLREHGLDVRRAKWWEHRRDARTAARWFVKHVQRPSLRVMEQVGIKEIRYGPGWSQAVDVLGDIRVVSLLRDPRDIYLSLAERRARLPDPSTFELSPASLASELDFALSAQAALELRAPSMRVRYEDLCTDPEVLAQVLAFVESPLSEPGRFGAFTRSPIDYVTTSKVARWRNEPDEQLAREAHEVIERLSSHCERWGYT